MSRALLSPEMIKTLGEFGIGCCLAAGVAVPAMVTPTLGLVAILSGPVLNRLIKDKPDCQQALEEATRGIGKSIKLPGDPSPAEVRRAETLFRKALKPTETLVTMEDLRGYLGDELQPDLHTPLALHVLSRMAARVPELNDGVPRDYARIALDIALKSAIHACAPLRHKVMLTYAEVTLGDVREVKDSLIRLHADEAGRHSDVMARLDDILGGLRLTRDERRTLSDRALGRLDGDAATEDVFLWRLETALRQMGDKASHLDAVNSALDRVSAEIEAATHKLDQQGGSHSAADILDAISRLKESQRGGLQATVFLKRVVMGGLGLVALLFALGLLSYTRHVIVRGQAELCLPGTSSESWDYGAAETQAFLTSGEPTCTPTPAEIRKAKTLRFAAGLLGAKEATERFADSEASIARLKAGPIATRAGYLDYCLNQSGDTDDDRLHRFSGQIGVNKALRREIPDAPRVPALWDAMAMPCVGVPVPGDNTGLIATDPETSGYRVTLCRPIPVATRTAYCLDSWARVQSQIADMDAYARAMGWPLPSKQS